MSNGCDLLLIFNARDKLREKNATINRLRNQISLLEGTLREKCEEVTILHEQLFALTQRVDCLSSKKNHQITRFTTTSRSYNSTSILDDISSSNIANCKPDENEATTYSNKIDERLQSIKLLAAKSPLNNYNHLCMPKNINKNIFELPIYDDRIRRVSECNTYEHPNMEILNNNLTTSCGDQYTANKIRISRSSVIRCRSYSDSNESNSLLHENTPSPVGLPLYSKTTDTLLIKKRPSHAKTNSYSMSRTFHAAASSNYGPFENSCFHFNNVPPHLKPILHEIINEINFCTENNNKLKDELTETFTQINMIQKQNLRLSDMTVCMPLSTVTFPQQTKKSLIFTKYSFQTELLSQNEQFTIFLRKIVANLQNTVI